MPPGRSLIAREAGLDSATLVLTAQLAQLGIVFGEHEFGSGERATMALSAQQAQLSIVVDEILVCIAMARSRPRPNVAPHFPMALRCMQSARRR